MEWEAGKGFMGGSFRQAPDEPARRILRAIDIHTGKAVWELPQKGAAVRGRRCRVEHHRLRFPGMNAPDVPISRSSDHPVRAGVCRPDWNCRAPRSP
jgi:hypothetical protein